MAGSVFSRIDDATIRQLIDVEAGIIANGPPTAAIPGVEETGGDGPDTLTGGDGPDTLTGGDGDDVLAGGYSGDSLVGGAGNDVILPGSDTDTIATGAGFDGILINRNTLFPGSAIVVTDLATGDVIAVANAEPGDVAIGTSPFVPDVFVDIEAPAAGQVSGGAFAQLLGVTDPSQVVLDPFGDFGLTTPGVFVGLDIDGDGDIDTLDAPDEGPTTFAVATESRPVAEPAVLEEADERLAIEIVRQGPTDTPGSVDYTIDFGTVTNLTDVRIFQGTVPIQDGTGTIGFEPGVASVTLQAFVTQDRLAEPDESFTITLSDPVGADLDPGRQSATYTITDTRPVLRAKDTTSLTGTAGDDLLDAFYTDPPGPPLDYEVSGNPLAVDAGDGDDEIRLDLEQVRGLAIDGGDGIDTVVFDGDLADFQTIVNALFADGSFGDAATSIGIEGVEFLQFDDIEVRVPARILFSDTQEDPSAALGPVVTAERREMPGGVIYDLFLERRGNTEFGTSVDWEIDFNGDLSTGAVAPASAEDFFLHPLSGTADFPAGVTTARIPFGLAADGTEPPEGFVVRLSDPGPSTAIGAPDRLEVVILDEAWEEPTAGDDLLIGSPEGDLIVGDRAIDTSFGGNDTVRGGGGNDTVHGGPGDDEVSGEEGDDSLKGDAGEDSLEGGSGRDTLLGGAGDDTLLPGAGNDVVTGGPGDDLAVFDFGTPPPPGETDVVTDLGPGDAVVIDGLAGPGQVGLFTDPSLPDPFIVVDVDNDPANGFEADIRLAGVPGVASLATVPVDGILDPARTAVVVAIDSDGDGTPDTTIPLPLPPTTYAVATAGRTVSEPSSTLTVTVLDIEIVREGAVDEPGSVAYTLGGTATSDDVTIVERVGASRQIVKDGGVIAFEPGVRSVTIEAIVRGDNQTEPDETLTIALSDPAGGVIDPDRGSATYTIRENETVEQPEPDPDTGVITVNPEGPTRGRDGDDILDATGEIESARVEAGDGDDEIRVSDGAPVNVNGGNGVDTIVFDASIDDVEGTSASFVEVLTGDLGRFDSLGSVRFDNVEIIRFDDAEIIVPSSVFFEATHPRELDSATRITNTSFRQVEEPEDAPIEIKIDVERRGNGIQETSVDWRVDFVVDTGNPASAEDFAPGTEFSGTLTFGRNVMEQSIVLTLLPDDLDEDGQERFSVFLGNPGVNTTLDFPQSQTVFINDEDSEIDDGVDLLQGEAEGEIILGGKGDSIILGAGGNDTLDGGTGNDSVDGGEGDDVVDGEDGDDVIVGNGGDDTLHGGEGDDALSGGEGHDVKIGGEGDDRARGGEGDDTSRGADGDDTLKGSAGEDSLSGNGGSDLLAGQEGDDTLNGGADDDTLVGGADEDDLSGNRGDDKLVGGAGDDPISGGAGNDTVRGGAGNDTLDGGAGDDRIFAGDGEDLVLFGPGDDRVRLGEDGAADTLRLAGGSGRNSIVGFEVGTDVVDFTGTGIESLADAGIALRPNGNLVLRIDRGEAPDAVFVFVGDFTAADLGQATIIFDG